MHAHVADRLTRSPGLTARSHQCQSDTLGAASPHRRTWRQRARAGPVTQSQRAWREMWPRSSLRGPRPPCSGQRGWGPMRTASSVSTRKDCCSPDCEGTNRFHTVIKRCLQSDRCPQPGNSAARQKPRAGARLSLPLWCHGRGRVPGTAFLTKMAATLGLSRRGRPRPLGPEWPSAFHW